MSEVRLQCYCGNPAVIGYCEKCDEDHVVLLGWYENALEYIYKKRKVVGEVITTVEDKDKLLESCIKKEVLDEILAYLISLSAKENNNGAL